jgi:hypothetical protein
MPAALLDHMREHGGDAVQRALEIDVDAPFPVLDLAPLQGRVRHDAGIVDDHVDSPVCVHGMIDKADDLLVLRHIRLHDGLVTQRQFIGERLEPIQTPCAQHHVRALCSQPASGRRAVSAAGSGDDNDLVLDPRHAGRSVNAPTRDLRRTAVQNSSSARPVRDRPGRVIDQRRARVQ